MVVFAGITFVLVAGLGLLGSRLLEQDRALVTQRIQDRLERAADRTAAELLRRLAETERFLVSLATLPDSALDAAAPAYARRIEPDALVLVLTENHLETIPRSGLLYYPVRAPVEEPPADAFRQGEVYEFQRRDLPRAIATFRQLARSENSAIRAGALLRLARVLRKAGRRDSALGAYAELASLGAAPAGALPAALVAGHARCVLLEELGRPADLRREAEALYAGLQEGRWRLSRATYAFYSRELEQWIGPDRGGAAAALGLTAAAEWLWQQWRVAPEHLPAPGWRSLLTADRSMLVMRHAERERMVGFVAGPGHVERAWLGPLQPWLDEQGVQVALTDAEGHYVFGQFSDGNGPHALRTAADVQLPWALRLVSADPGAATTQLAERRRLLLIGITLVTTIVLVGMYFIARAVTRELAVARLQSDFVAAVSHEFRTPLTSMRQLTELLSSGRLVNEKRRAEYYSVIKRESERLHRLVESLLDFGRMEAGAREFRFEPLNAAALVEEVVEEFRHEHADDAGNIALGGDGAAAVVRADRDALGRAIWNLLDNAIKYSPERGIVAVDVRRADGTVTIRVRDRGVGIPPDECKEIFRKFVRGASAKAAGVKGTGIGLAMVQHIVDAHHGEVRLESAPGAGSTFTLSLPAEE